jgi:hypothetical protein
MSVRVCTSSLLAPSGHTSLGRGEVLGFSLYRSILNKHENEKGSGIEAHRGRAELVCDGLTLMLWKRA